MFRTDVKSYYASIDHQVLLDRLAEWIGDRRALALLQGYLRRTIYDAGFYEDVQSGIALGCPLSPLMGAVYLSQLDQAMEASGLFYARFMDDWVILSPSRWKLRRAIRAVNQLLEKLKVKQHPRKTFIGRISRGFDFLGYRFLPSGLGVAQPTVELGKGRNRFGDGKLRVLGHEVGCRLGRGLVMPLSLGTEPTSPKLSAPACGGKP